MGWYRAGNVAITSGSTTVTGTGTAFAANCRVGDEFKGPDGRGYEVVNVASDRVLSIAPAYQGPTVTSGAYSLVPIQGYPKDLSDRFKQISEQWGHVLAILGTGQTAGELRANIGAAASGQNADITELNALTKALTVTQGGTGAKTPAAARTALELKSAAVADIVGTVSQAAGVPTGAIVEYGSNANGKYVKFAGGTMWCWHSKLPTLVTSVAVGQGFQAPAVVRYDFPVTFVGDESSVVVVPQAMYVQGPSQPSGAVSRKTTTFANIIATGFNSGIEVQTGYMAIGRWHA